MQEKKNRPEQQDEVAEDEVTEAAADTSEVDDLLDEIDDVLEENAEAFITNYVQLGGE